MTESLSLEKGFWPMLALDHGLTEYSDAVPVSSIPFLIRECEEKIGAVVMTYGIARYIAENPGGIKIVIQCFCSPFDHPKIQVCDVEQAEGLNASAIAVQIDFSLSAKDLNEQLSAVSKIVASAHRKKIPVLFMVASSSLNSFLSFSQSVRFCHELGADLIKVRIDITQLMKVTEVDKFSELLNHSPPVLLAGGKPNDLILQEISAARKLGFSGYCIGRNLFQADDPSEMSRLLYDAWYN